MSNDACGGAPAWASRQKVSAAVTELVRDGGPVLAAKATGRGQSWV